MASVAKREWTHGGDTKTAWVVRYTDQAGKRRMKTFEQKKQADKYRVKVETEIEKGEHTPDSEGRTVGEVCKLYLDYSEDRVRDGRIGRMRHRSIDMAVRNSIIPHLGRERFDKLTPVQIEEFYRTMVRKDGLKPKSARSRLQMLKQMEDFALRRRFTRVRVVPEATKELRGIREDPIRTFKPEEIKRLLKAVSTRGKGQHDHTAAHLNCAVNLAAFCGLRFGEIGGLRLVDVDFAKRRLCIRKSMSRFDGLKAPKTAAGRRDMPMPVHVASLLRDYIARFYIPNDDELVFRTRGGGTLVSSSFHHWHWPRLLEKAGLMDDGERFHFHALRHFAASWMIANGMPVTDVAQLLGHAKFDMTLQVYAHPIVSNSFRHDTIERMSAALIEAPIVIDETPLSVESNAFPGVLFDASAHDI